MTVEHFGSPLPGLGDYAPEDQTGVWWTQATFKDGLARWCCAACGRRGQGLSIWWAQFRHRTHRCKAA